MSDTTPVRIIGTGSCLPERRLDNEALFALPTIGPNFDVERARAALKDIPEAGDLTDAQVFDHWAVQLCGIRERRTVDPASGTTTEDLCAAAGKNAIEMAGIEATDLDQVIIASFTGAEEVPNMSCTVADRIGAPTLGGYTMNAACAGFTYGLAAGFAAIRSGVAKRVLVAAGETMSRVTDYTDPKTAVLFGDGAGAAVLSADGDGPQVIGIPALHGQYAHDPLWMVGQGWETEDEPVPKLHMQGGPSILRRAVGQMANMAIQAIESAGRTMADVDLLIPHQANKRITQALEKKLALPKGRVLDNIEPYGNISGATVAVALDEALRGMHGALPKPAVTVLTAVGGGYSTAAIALEG